MNNLNRFDIVITFYDDIYVELSFNGVLYRFKSLEKPGWLSDNGNIDFSRSALLILEKEVDIEIIGWLKKMLLTGERQSCYLSYTVLFDMSEDHYDIIVKKIPIAFSLEIADI